MFFMLYLGYTEHKKDLSYSKIFLNHALNYRFEVNFSLKDNSISGNEITGADGGIYSN